MDSCSLDKFVTYKSDWSFPITIRHFPHRNIYKGKCVTFQECMKVMLVVGQCFALNPVLGVCESDAFKLRFTFCSWLCVYTLTIIFLQSILIFLHFLTMMWDTDSSLNTNTSTIFQTMNTITAVLFLRIAMKWPRLCMKISRTETADPNPDTGLTRRCNMSCFVIFSLALCEHLLAEMYGITRAIDCEPKTNVYEAFMKYSFPGVFAYIPYNHYFGAFCQFLNIQCTFNWNFADVFVICMSLYLTSRLQQVNQRIAAVRGKIVPSTFWRLMREDYNRIAHLVRQFDDVIGSVMFISFANNLFFICFQLLHTLADGIKATPHCDTGELDVRPLHGFEQAVYFMFSFAFLVFRSLAVSLSASSVHTASKAPASALYDVPSAGYCIEVQRFLEQIHGNSLALSGLQFFYVKRGLVLSIAGTIVTYELVLMQFTGVTPTSPSPI